MNPRNRHTTELLALPANCRSWCFGKKAFLRYLFKVRKSNNENMFCREGGYAEFPGQCAVSPGQPRERSHTCAVPPSTAFPTDALAKDPDTSDILPD